MPPLRLAIIGAGHLGRIHARIAQTVPGIELAAVADPLEANRAQAESSFGVRAVADYRQLLGQIDAAVVAAPTQLHHRLGMELLAAGVHVLMEKPLAAHLAEADDLVQAARRHARVLQVGHVERFNPAMHAALPHLREPRFIEASRQSGFTGRSTDIGVVLDLMIHDIDLVLWLVRSPLVRAEALGIAVLGRHEDAAHARLEFENGCIALLKASRVSYQATRQMQVWTPTAFASLDFANRSVSLVRPSQELLKRSFSPDMLPMEERLAMKDQLYAKYLLKEDLQAPPMDAITAEQQDFLESIRTGRPPRVSGEQARDALAVAEEILASMAGHRWDGQTAGGRVGHLALPAASIVPPPHFAAQAALKREAG